MLWDVFCRVIDNFGDIGVCWRLAVDLGQRGHQVRLWVDDAQALSWMAPHLRWQTQPEPRAQVGLGQTGVSVHAWADAERPHPALSAGEVVIEAFGCNPPDAFIALMQRPHPPQWVNLEYLSAEAYVERSHGLRSPVWSGAGQGLSKRFFYPGFTVATGGLLREPGLIDRADAFRTQADAAPAWLHGLGIETRPHEARVSVFCYDHAPLPELLTQLASLSHPTHVLLTPGHATRLAQVWQDTQAPTGSRLRLSTLPALPQAEFDTLLWSCELNFVRGEDSAVRALWAGRPHVWQIYEQDDGVHADKLDAFMDRWMAPWPTPLQQGVRAWWRAWNRLGPMPQTLPDWHAPVASSPSAWALASLQARSALQSQTDLVTQLLQFVAGSG